MRICSLLPSLTETLFALGLGDQVVGVTHECDWPPEAQSKVPLTKNKLRVESCASGEIDRQVREATGSLYELDVAALERLEPDLVLTQSLCPVCAVDEGIVRRAAAQLSHVPTVLAYHPTRLSEVTAMIREIGAVTGAVTSADSLLRRFADAIEHVRAGVARTTRRPRLVCLEWIDPPFASGHWTPELVAIAGAVEPLGVAGDPSRSVQWAEIVAARPEIILIAPCGFSLDRTVEEMHWLDKEPSWQKLDAVRSHRVYCADGSAYFNRPGPRLIESFQIVAEVVHPEIFGGLSPRGAFQHFDRFKRNSS